MRIVYVIEQMACKGGLERIITDKVNYLAEHTNHEIILMTVWHSDTPMPYPLCERVLRINLNVSVAPIPMGYAFSLPTALQRFNRLMLDLTPDVTIVFRAVGAFLCAFTKWRGRMIYESHVTHTHMNHQWIYPLMEKRIDCVVCLTEEDAKSFRRAQRVEVIPNFISVCPAGEPDYTRKHCICVGRLEKEKGHERLIRLWQEIHRRQPDWVLDIYGDGRLQSHLQALIDSLSLSDCVMLHGRSDNIAARYQESSIMLLTSEFEGFGLTIAEAMTCGLPVVAFDCPVGPREIIADGKNGFLIPYHDDKDFIDKVCLLMENADRRKEMGIMAQQSTARFSKAPIMSKWLKVLRSPLTP